MNDINYYMQICVCVRDRATERNADPYVSVQYVCVCVRIHFYHAEFFWSIILSVGGGNGIKWRFHLLAEPT